jgi:hypothetical protein
MVARFTDMETVRSLNILKTEDAVAWIEKIEAAMCNPQKTLPKPSLHAAS